MSGAPRARVSDLDLIRELHTGQRRVNDRIKRPDTRKHLDYAPRPLRIFLRKPGRPHTALGLPPGTGPSRGSPVRPLLGRVLDARPYGDPHCRS